MTSSPLGRLAGLPSTYIPMKNSIYYSVAAAFAEEVGAGIVSWEGTTGRTGRSSRTPATSSSGNLQRVAEDGLGQAQAAGLQDMEAAQGHDQGGGGGAGRDARSPARDDMELPQGRDRPLLGVRGMPAERAGVSSRRGSSTLSEAWIDRKGLKEVGSGQIRASRKGP